MQENFRGNVLILDSLNKNNINFSFHDVTADEFVLVMAILGHSKIADTISGQQQLVDLVAEQCRLLQPFVSADEEQFDRMIICIKHALPYFSVCLLRTYDQIIIFNQFLSLYYLESS